MADYFKNKGGLEAEDFMNACEYDSSQCTI